MAEEPDNLTLYTSAVYESCLHKLSRDEEQSLIRAAQGGDRAARDRVVIANLRLVLSVARKHTERNVDMLDLIQVGNMALMHAIDKFDVNKEGRFSTYASVCMHWQMMRAIHKSHAIPLPDNLASRLSELARTENGLCQELGRMPTAEELAAATDLSQPDLACIQRSQSGGLPLFADNEPVNALDMDDTEQEALNTILSCETMGFLKFLTTQEQTVLRARYGLGETPPVTLAAVAGMLGVSIARVHTVEQQALQKVRTLMGLVYDPTTGQVIDEEDDYTVATASADIKAGDCANCLHNVNGRYCNRSGKSLERTQGRAYCVPTPKMQT